MCLGVCVCTFCIYDSVYASQLNKCTEKAEYLIPFYSLVYKYVASFVDSSDLKSTGNIYACYMTAYLDEVVELGGVCLAAELRCALGKILSTLPSPGAQAI